MVWTKISNKLSLGKNSCGNEDFVEHENTISLWLLKGYIVNLHDLSCTTPFANLRHLYLKH